MPFPTVSHRVYPRARGGAPIVPLTDGTTWGLSPRTRGSPRPRRHRSPLHRVYPRARGGASSSRVKTNHGPRRSIPAHAGEPRSGERGHGWGKGSIPAHAGEPSLPCPCEPRSGLSPRTRGSLDHAPLSPRRLTRGSRIAGEMPRVYPRSIPAHAGEPATSIPLQTPSKVRRDGSIPAHAGEPSKIPDERRSARVYPRARGGATRGRPGPLGLSPRTRGSRSWAPMGITGRVYPRARGGASPNVVDQTGLSPRTRGSLRRL